MTLVSWISWEIGQGLFRSLLLGAGGYFVADGLLTQADLNSIVGAVLVIGGVIWSAISNRQKAVANATVAAVNAHPDITVTPAAQSGTGKPVVTVQRPELPTPSLVKGA